MNKLHIAAAIAAFSLSACGGGGGAATPVSTTPTSNTPTTPVTPPAPQPVISAEGLWNGTTNNGRLISGLVLNDGTIWVIYSSQSNQTQIAGVIQGSGQSNNGSFTVANSLDFNLQGNGIMASSVSASYIAQKTFSGTVTYPGIGVQTFTATYSTNYDITPSLATVAGTYAGVSAVKGGNDSGTITIDASGNLKSTAVSGCISTGTIAPRAKGNVYNLTVTYGNSPCLSPGATVTGIGYLDPTTKRMYGTALNATRDNGFIFVGQKTS
ncbi:hypothetical protein ACO0K7_09120 [Undibacterium sp. Ji67W]|uniref:hypothetical protein n=1 Tax=Undibacterium sp. Ji67W TaxID=3413042 RepID=UPI003BF0E152